MPSIGRAVAWTIRRTFRLDLSNLRRKAPDETNPTTGVQDKRIIEVVLMILFDLTACGTARSRL